MSKLLDTCIDLFETYKSWVILNPQTVGDLETTIKWASFFITGRISNSPVFTELTYSLSNILVLLNDQILAKSVAGNSLKSDSQYRLQILLTTLEYCEVFIELSAKQIWGDHGRWFFIFVVQVVKFVFRLLLTFKYREPMVHSPATQSVNRKELKKTIEDQALDEDENNSFGINVRHSFELRRSGRVIRRVEGAPPVNLRQWIPPKSKIELTNKLMGKRFTTAETIYICRPLLHLGGVASFGLNSWKSYGIAFLLDFYSLYVYNRNRSSLSKNQKLELSRRNLQMIMYLMRSPFFEKFTNQRITNCIDRIGSTIPFTKTICSAANSYIPYWQSIYFYVWGS